MRITREAVAAERVAERRAWADGVAHAEFAGKRMESLVFSMKGLLEALETGSHASAGLPEQ
eukprot:5498936-Prorocentrum_lima.AAC.1